MDSLIEKYRFTERISLWEFKVAHSDGYNISFSPKARLQIMELLGLMKKSPWPSHKKIKLVSPEEMSLDWVRNVGEHIIFNSLTISYRKGQSSLCNTEDDGRDVKLILGDDAIKEFENCIETNLFDEAWATGESKGIWFW